MYVEVLCFNVARTLRSSLHSVDICGYLTVARIIHTYPLLPPSPPTELSRRGVSLADYHRVAGVHWLCMDGAHRFQATKEANALARSLLLDRQVVHSEMEGQDDNGSRGKLAAAEALLVGLEHSHDAHQGHGLHPLGLSDPEEPILPPDTADVLKGILKTSEEDDPKRDDLENALKEYTGWCDLLYAYQAYKKWRIALSESGTAQWEAYVIRCLYTVSSVATLSLVHMFSSAHALNAY